MKNPYKRKHRKRIRKAFKTRCYALERKVSSVGIRLHWSRVKGQPRSTTLFSLWERNGVTRISDRMNLDEMERYIEKYFGLRAFW